MPSTTTYLINRIPTLVLGHQSPYLLLFQTKLDYILQKTFGCACFPLLRPYSAHKLSYRSKKCIFIGYATNKKATNVWIFKLVIFISLDM
ncbi:hypothetical protein Patl1_05145 [Pistacia atlantica]|uniref:Uncharacterized protein n=1 Tax=Pistacia atlantica TaxID=434234 RepID=A0ACC1BQC9_9ROSI|nr:hypothetical protein Patl1_05145 [Pistacia atlantica]